MVDEAKNPSYDEDQWQRSLQEAEQLAPEEEPLEMPASVEPVEEGGLPDLESLVAKLPPNSRELLDTLFRGQFVAVKRLNRKKLF